jgi:N-acetylneuraminic acid mutarotase
MVPAMRSSLALMLGLLCACAAPEGPSTPGWRTVAKLAGGPRQESGVAALDGHVYVVGGITPTGFSARVEIYDPFTDSWREGPALPREVHHPNLAAVGDTLYLVGSLIEGGFQAHGTVYALSGSSWSTRTAMPPGTERGASAVAVVGARIVVAGGYRGGASVADASVYDPAADRWTPLPPLPEARDHLVGVETGGQFFAVSGRRDGQLLARVDVLDLQSEQWREAPPLPTARAGTAGAAVNGQLVVAGGEGNRALSSGVFAHTEVYDATARSWSAASQMPTPRHGLGAAVIKGHVYFPGGATVEGAGAVDTHEVFVP